MKPYWILLATPLLLTGCGAVQKLQAMQDDLDDKRCQSFGAKPGSDAYVNCRVGLSKEHADANSGPSLAEKNRQQMQNSSRVCTASRGGNTIFVQCSP